MSMNVQLASIAVAPTLCASICQEATDVNAGVVMSLQMTGTLASVSARITPFGLNGAKFYSLIH